MKDKFERDFKSMDSENNIDFKDWFDPEIECCFKESRRKMNKFDYVKLVQELNNIVPESYDERYSFSYSTNGDCHTIYFGDCQIYNSFEDCELGAFSTPFENSMRFIINRAKEYFDRSLCILQNVKI